MKKYNLSEIMKEAWRLKRIYKLAFSQCLKKAWAEAKEKMENAIYYGIKFVNHMDVCANGYVRELSRWTKNGHDRVYINGGSRRGDGYVDLKTGRTFLNGNLAYQKIIAEMILSMEF